MNNLAESGSVMSEPGASEYECRFENVVDLPRARAFQLVVDYPELWWTSPFRDSRGQSLDAGIDPFVGGACYQIDGKGTRQVWGTVLSIEAPLYLRIAWQVSQDGQQIADPSAASRVMISFRDSGERTRVEVVHNKFLRHGENGGDYMQELMTPEGWPRVLANVSRAAVKMPRV